LARLSRAAGAVNGRIEEFCHFSGAGYRCKATWYLSVQMSTKPKEADMEYTQLTKQMIDFQKMSFDNWYGALSMMQNQAVSAMDMMLGQSTWLPEDGRQAIRQWINVCKQEEGRFKSYVDGSFTGLEKYLNECQKQAAGKSKKATNQQGG
jgi:prenyltransferase beta subunit